MDIIKQAANPTDLEPRENDERAARAGAQPEVRSLSDYELWFVGGGEDTPHW